MDLKVLGLHEKHVDRNQLVLVFFSFFLGLIAFDPTVHRSTDQRSRRHWKRVPLAVADTLLRSALTWFFHTRFMGS